MSVGGDMGQLEPCERLVRIQPGEAPKENMWKFLQNRKRKQRKKLAIKLHRLRQSTSACAPRTIQSKVRCLSMVALFAWLKMWKPASVL
jgi:hypothetical protein